MSDPRGPWVRINRPAAQLDPGVEGAVGLEEAGRAIAPELGHPPEKIRMALLRAVKLGYLQRAAGGGRRGASVWVFLEDARAWSLHHYRGGPMAKARNMAADVIDSLEACASALLERLRALESDDRAVLGIEHLGTGRRGCEAVIMAVRRVKSARERLSQSAEG